MASAPRAASSIVETAAPRLHVNALRDGELGARALDVAAKLAWTGCLDAGVGEEPSVFQQCLAVTVVGGMDIEGDLERAVDEARQRHHLPELVHFEPIGPSVVGHGPESAPPSSDGRE